MQCTQKPPATKRRFYTSPRVLCILGFVFTYLVVLTAFAPSALAASLSAPGGNVADPVVRQVDIARPAVVRIVTTLDGQLTVRFSSTVTATFPQDGSSYSLGLTGSGAFISARGEILTADHVINPPHGQDLDADLYSHAAQDVADYINAHFQITAPYSASDAYSLLLSGSLPSTTSYGQPSSEVYLSTSYVGSINAAKLETVPSKDHATVDRIEAQSNFTANDVAIIHVSGMDNMPSIQLGDSSKVAEQDNLTIIGYPGLADLSEAPTNYLTSSINKIYVSALKITDAGAPVIQVGGNVEHGDSGGPALDSNGNIVGIVSFGYSGVNGDYGQTTFLQASNSALTLIKTQGINTTPGAFEVAWAQAIDDYASLSSGHWQKAAQELKSLASSYPNFVGVAPYLAYAQNQASREQNAPAASGSTTVWIIVAIVVLLLLALGGFYLLFRRSARPAVVAPGGVQYPSGAYGFYQPQSGIYPPLPAAYGTGVPYQPVPVMPQPLPGVLPGTPQPLPSGVVYPNYTSPAAYGAPPAQVPQTPQPVISAKPLPPASTSEQNGAFSLPIVQTPQPLEPALDASSLSTGMPPMQADDSAGGVESAQELPAQSQTGNGTLAEVLEKSATYVLPTDQAEMLSARMLAVSPGETRLPSGDSWPAVATGEEIAPVEEEKTLLAQSPARSFSVPRRPATSETVASEAGAETANLFTWVAPCGHANAPDVRFCRVCGQSVSPTASVSDTL